MSPFSLHQRFSLARDCAKYVTWPNILQLVGEYPRIFENDLNDNKHNRLHLARKYARIFVLWHYLFLEAHSFPRATLLENCSPLGTDLVECPRTNILAYFRAKWRLLFIERLLSLVFDQWNLIISCLNSFGDHIQFLAFILTKKWSRNSEGLNLLLWSLDYLC